MNRRVEHDLLLCVARRDLTESYGVQLDRLLAQSPDWDYVLKLAGSHGLIPLLHRHIGSSSPGELSATLKHEVFENCQTVLHLLGRLSKLLKHFESENIATLVFKGPVLSEIAYGDKSLRQAGDIDVLIQPEDFLRAKKSLELLGYRMVPPLNASQLKAHLKFHCEATFSTDDGFTIVDLHWALTPSAFPLTLPVNNVMQRRQELNVAGIKLETFATVDLILFQCIHGAKHFWSRLEWIAALSEVIRRTEHIDWNVLTARAREVHVARIVALGLNLAKSVGDVAIPEDVLRELDADRSSQVTADNLLAHIFEQREPRYASVRAIRNKFRVMDRKRDVLLSVFRVVFVPTFSDWDSIKLLPPWDHLYYVVRPVRLIKSYAVLLCRRFIPERKARPQPVQKRLSEGLIE